MRRYIIAGTFCPRSAADSIYGAMADAINAEVLTLPWLGIGHTRNTADAIARLLPKRGQIDLIGHSQGGLVALDIASRDDSGISVRRCVTLGAPLGGTALSPQWAPFPSARCMSRGSRYTSEVWRRWRSSVARHFTGLHCVAGTEDKAVIPTQTAHVSGARNYTLRGLSHTDLATHGDSIALVHDIVWPEMRGILPVLAGA